ncbi:quinone oxidoreductase family protein [Actinomadura rayongensis]|uniref:Zinc-binding dehydrogenase n=1 Tax=Actinomadura rayongensis TaxID=1429076 RepID=A0A6I4WFL4_9ACTN|nr:zinc-binding alcohol dehydrogenase family protein [Actinomadura rayongensis]MXQ66646.1 zinc-binding dehydrogenase [Actinomadura rayongensis]
MHAAIVHAFGSPPRYGTVPEPVADGADEVLVDVLAAGLHPRVRSGADGSHYTSDGVLPLVPGVDAVGRAPGGELLYFVALDGEPGTMAERAVADRRRAVVLPPDADPVAVAAAMNPAMSSWIALRSRIGFRPGGSVLVLGATGGAGRLAVQIARRLGAARVVGAGRDERRLAPLRALGADATVRLDDTARLAETAADVDVVLDYVWGPPTEQAMPALLRARKDRSKPLSWIQIGSVAGAEITLPSALLRVANLTLLGSGQGSVSTAGIVAELPSLAEVIPDLAMEALPMPLDRVEQAWSAPVEAGRRIVLVP